MPSAREVSIGFFDRICHNPSPNIVAWLENLVVSMRRDYDVDAPDVDIFVAYARILFLRAREYMRLPLTRLTIVACMQLALYMLDDYDQANGYFDEHLPDPCALSACVTSVFVDGLRMNACVHELI